MIIAAHRPRAPLDQFIELLWFHEGLNAPHPMERVIPDGSVELIINLRDEPRHVFDPSTRRAVKTYRQSWLSGPHSHFIVIDTAPNASMIGAHFKPGTASAFFGLPLSELLNSVWDLADLWNGGASILREQLLQAPGPASKFRVLENALLARWRAGSNHRAVDFALAHITRQPESATIGRLTSEVGLTSRRFIALFADQVGLTPKKFSRVQRLQHALRSIAKKSVVVWTDVAFEAGYYDQAHFINDFKEFCGLTPGEYLASRSDYPNFVPVLD